MPAPRLLTVFLLALTLAMLPRVVAPERFITADEEMFWQPRSDAFLRGLRTGDLGETCQAPHPGVTTMWCGVAGRLAWQATGGEAKRPIRGETSQQFRRWSRFFVSLTTALCVAGVVTILWIRRGAPLALTSAVLLSADPFFTAHSRILHNDALNAGFFLLALTAAWAGATTSGAPRLRWLALAGAAATLSTLSKVSGVLAFPCILALGLYAVARDTREVPALSPRLRQALRLLIPAGGAVALAALATALLVWPALWADPAKVVDAFANSLGLGGAEHEHGNFFAGERVGDPGPWFYPAVIAFRLTPITTFGALLGLLVTLQRRDALGWLMIGGTVVFVAVLSQQGKKFDRYLLAVFPLIDVLAAIGWVGVAQGLATRWTAARTTLVTAAASLGGAALAFAPTIQHHPYQITTYNALLGGAPVAQDWLLVGWGEGLEQVGDWLSEHTSCDESVRVFYYPCLRPFICNPVRSMRTRKPADWTVVYINQRQRDKHKRHLRPLAGREPAFTARANGIDLAWVYRTLPEPPEEEDEPEEEADDTAEQDPEEES